MYIWHENLLEINHQTLQGRLPMKRLALCVLILVGLVLGVWAGNYYWQGTPRCSLYRMAKAIKNNDPQTFLSYVDMDQVLEGMVDSTIKEVREKNFSEFRLDRTCTRRAFPRKQRV